MSISLTYTFTANTTIVSSQVNSNFTTLATRALDKTGDTMTGDLKFTDATYDIGKTGATRPRDFFLSRNATIGGTLGVTGVATFTANPKIVSAGNANFLVKSASSAAYSSITYGDASTYGWDVGNDNSGSRFYFYNYNNSAYQLYLSAAGVLTVNGGQITVTNPAASSTLLLNPLSNSYYATATYGDASTYGWTVGKDDSAGTRTGVAESFYWYSQKATAGYRMILSPAGALTCAKQPGFLAYNSANDVTQSGGATIDFDTEVYDEAGNFSGDTFTAPVTGRYLFTVNVAVGAGSVNTQTRSLFLITSNRSYAFSGVVAALTTDIVYLTGSVIADMDAADTASVQISLSSGTVTIVGDATVLYTSFSGRLLP